MLVLGLDKPVSTSTLPRFATQQARFAAREAAAEVQKAAKALASEQEARAEVARDARNRETVLLQHIERAKAEEAKWQADAQAQAKLLEQQQHAKAAALALRDVRRSQCLCD